MAIHAITMADGSVGIMQTVGEASAAECIRKWPGEVRANVIDHAEIAPQDVPGDRTFRDAWTMAGRAIVHDMAKARDIKRGQLRAQRAPLFAALDMAYLRADETKDEAAKAAIAADKQKLCDATADPAIDAALTVEELKAIRLPVVNVPASAGAATDAQSAARTA